MAIYSVTKAAVAVLIPGHKPDIIEVERYPGGDRSAKMVPSVLSYSAHGGGGGRVCFGFEAQEGLDFEKSERVVYGRFKAKFPSGTVRPLNALGPTRDVLDLYSTMVQFMYLHIRDFYSSVVKMGYPVFLPDWERIPVEFSFTVPAVGDPQIAGEKLKELARQAGFGSVPGHSVSADVLTEGEASAIYSLMHSKNSGDLEVRRNGWDKVALRLYYIDKLAPLRISERADHCGRRRWRGHIGRCRLPYEPGDLGAYPGT